MDVLRFLRENIPSPFRPEPFLITPRNDNERHCGKATLLTPSQIETILSYLPDEEDPELIDKLVALLDD